MKVTVEGMADVQRVLRAVAPKHARNLVRATVHAVAADLAKEAKTLAPRDTGKLRKGIKAKRRRGKPNVFQSDVVVQQKVDEQSIFYWRFVEHGTVNRSERPFIRPAFTRVSAEVERLFVVNFGRKLEAAVRRQAKK